MNGIDGRSATRIIGMIVASWTMSTIISVPPLFGLEDSVDAFQTRNRTLDDTERSTFGVESPTEDLSPFDEREYDSFYNNELISYSDYQYYDVMGSAEVSLIYVYEDVNSSETDCIISQNLGYTVFSTVGAFYLPLASLIFSCSNIYVPLYGTVHLSLSQSIHQYYNPHTSITIYLYRMTYVSRDRRPVMAIQDGGPEREMVQNRPYISTYVQSLSQCLFLCQTRSTCVYHDLPVLTCMFYLPLAFIVAVYLNVYRVARSRIHRRQFNRRRDDDRPGAPRDVTSIDPDETTQTPGVVWQALRTRLNAIWRNSATGAVSS